MSESPTTRVIRTDYLSRVEGEGAMYVKVDGETVCDVKLRIYEPPRFFEAFLRGRGYTETPDIVARICGICPIAYQMSAVHAIENAFGVAVDGQLRALRRLQPPGRRPGSENSSEPYQHIMRACRPMLLKRGRLRQV